MKKPIPIEQLFFCYFGDFKEVYLPKQKNRSSCTCSTYKTSLKKFREYINNVKGIRTNQFRFADCTYDFLLDYRNYLHDNNHLSERTCNNRLSAIKSYTNYAAARDVTLQQYAFAINNVPGYVEPKIMQSIIDDVDSLEALLKAPPNTKKGLRDKTMMAILYDGGIRLEELVSLRVRDIKLEEDQYEISLHGKGNRERTDMLSIKTSSLLTQYMHEFHPYKDSDAPLIYTVIGGRKKQMSERNVQKLIKKYADLTRKEYELPDSVSPHTFRRTRGTLLYRDGTPIEDIAIKFGHANTKTTRDHYTSKSPEQAKELANKRTEPIPETQQLWPDDEDEMDKILGF